ncbi:MAG: hypothetical protein ACRENI_00075 [Gemmatimonadaceae bacterium]
MTAPCSMRREGRDPLRRCLADPSCFEAALLATGAVLAPFGGTRWARPGSGWHDARMIATMRRHGYRCVLGSVYPFDAELRSAGFARWYVLRYVHPGAIIILHDRGSRAMRTARVLAEVLPALGRRGYRLVTLDELLGPDLPAADGPQ